VQTNLQKELNGQYFSPAASQTSLTAEDPLKAQNGQEIDKKTTWVHMHYFLATVYKEMELAVHLASEVAYNTPVYQPQSTEYNPSVIEFWWRSR
jgi:hypothetical protein